MFDTVKKKSVIIVYAEKNSNVTKIIADLLHQEFSEIANQNTEIALNANVWDEKQYLNTKATIGLGQRIIVIGEPKEIFINIDEYYNEYATTYGWRGNKAHFYIDENKEIVKTAYNQFIQDVESETGEKFEKPQKRGFLGNLYDGATFIIPKSSDSTLTKLGKIGLGIAGGATLGIGGLLYVGAHAMVGGAVGNAVEGAFNDSDFEIDVARATLYELAVNIFCEEDYKKFLGI